MKLIKRQIENNVLDLYRKYPVITLTGPRQSGKTTLVRKLFPDKEYIIIWKTLINAPWLKAIRVLSCNK